MSYYHLLGREETTCPTCGQMKLSWQDKCGGAVCLAPPPAPEPAPEPCQDCGGRGFTEYNRYDGGGCPRCGGRGTER